jgi:2-C-methyl-D-erythritol 2,4-cyclodiphosphate synthase
VLPHAGLRRAPVGRLPRDLGSHFGTSAPQWRGASGADLLAETRRRVEAAGFAIGNVARAGRGNAPRLGPRRAEAQSALSAAVERR